MAYLWSVGVVEEGRVSWKSLRRGGEGVIGVEGSEATSHRLFLLRFAKSLSLDVRPLSSHRPPRGMRHVTGGIVAQGLCSGKGYGSKGIVQNRDVFEH